MKCLNREAVEESGLEILNLKQVALLEFQFEGKMNELLEANVFVADQFRGEIRECDGMNYFENYLRKKTILNNQFEQKRNKTRVVQRERNTI